MLLKVDVNWKTFIRLVSGAGINMDKIEVYPALKHFLSFYPPMAHICGMSSHKPILICM